MNPRGTQRHRVNSAPTTKLSAEEHASREAAAREWLTLRQVIGSTAAARQLGYSDQQLGSMAKKLGLAIPPLAAGNPSSCRQPKLSAKEACAREAATREWLSLRQEIGNAPAARQLGYSDQQLSVMAKRLGLAVPPLGVGHTSARRALTLPTAR